MFGMNVTLKDSKDTIRKRELKEIPSTLKSKDMAGGGGRWLRMKMSR